MRRTLDLVLVATVTFCNPPCLAAAARCESCAWAASSASHASSTAVRSQRISLPRRSRLTPSSHRLSSFCFPPVVSRGLRKLIPVGYCRRALTPRMARKLGRLRGALAAALACVAILACVFARIRASLLVPPSGQVLAQRTSSKKCPDDPSLCGPRKPSGMSEKEFQKQLKLRKAIMKTEVRLRDHVRHAPSRPPSPPHAHSQSCTQACSGNCRRSPHWVWR